MLRDLPHAAQWGLLIALSTLLVPLLELAHLPAALLLGPMAAGILLVAGDGSPRMPRGLFLAAQAAIGCMMGRNITLPILATMLHRWPLFLGAIASVIAASNCLGWLLARWRVLPGTTAIWGSAPGAATAMTLMAEAYGADVRLVAFMQYLRVAMVAIAASLISRILAVPAAGQVAAVSWFPPVPWPSFAGTLALAAAGAALGQRLRVPAGALVVPLAGAAALESAGILSVTLPPWLLAASYTVVGWNIGLRFTRPILVHALRAFPRVAASTLTLIAVCGGFAFVLTRIAGVDPLTAYLATSPGGADTVAIIAASSHGRVDMPFVTALQTGRFLVVLLAGPWLSRWIARHAADAA